MSIKPFDLEKKYEKDPFYDIIKNKIPAENLSPISGIYFLINNDKIVYIGRSDDIISRLKYHFQNPNKKFTYYHIIKMTFDTIKSQWAEGELIMKYQPKYNTLLPPDLPYKSFIGMAKKYFNIMSKRLERFAEYNFIKIYQFHKRKYLHISEFEKLLNLVEEEKGILWKKMIKTQNKVLHMSQYQEKLRSINN